MAKLSTTKIETETETEIDHTLKVATLAAADDETVDFHELDPTRKAHANMVAADATANVALMKAADAKAAAIQAERASIAAKAEAMAAAKIASYCYPDSDDSDYCDPNKEFY